jgi:hypothetical protein
MYNTQSRLEIPHVTICYNLTFNHRPTVSRNASSQQVIRVYNKLYRSNNLYIMKEGGDSVVVQERKEGEVEQKPISGP